MTEEEIHCAEYVEMLIKAFKRSGANSMSTAGMIVTCQMDANAAVLTIQSRGKSDRSEVVYGLREYCFCSTDSFCVLEQALYKLITSLCICFAQLEVNSGH